MCILHLYERIDTSFYVNREHLVLQTRIDCSLMNAMTQNIIFFSKSCRESFVYVTFTIYVLKEI